MTKTTSLSSRVCSVLGIELAERGAVFWSCGYFFFLLAAYYVLRPVRDTMGLVGGVRHLPWLFTAAFFALLVLQPVYSAAVAYIPPRTFIPLVYRFFTANVLIFWLLLTFHVATVYVARAFFVWVSVFNLFVVSVFWSFMADLYTSEQSKRLFGFISAGGTAGSLLGPSLAVTLSRPLGPVNLLLISALLLELALFCAGRLEKASPYGGQAQAGAASAEDGAVGGGALDGLKRLTRSPYLAGIAAWVSLLSFCATTLYLEQANVVSAASRNRAVQTRIFASIDLAVGVLTLLTQASATGRLVQRLGVGFGASLLPLAFGAGFFALWLTPRLTTVVAFQAVQRTIHFAISTPARQALFTVARREDKYKAKNAIDLVVYRGSDALWGWLFATLRHLHFSLQTIALVAVPVTAIWYIIAIALGRAFEQRARKMFGGTFLD